MVVSFVTAYFLFRMLSHIYVLFVKLIPSSIQTIQPLQASTHSTDSLLQCDTHIYTLNCSFFVPNLRALFLYPVIKLMASSLLPPEQLYQIRKSSMARLLCNDIDGVRELPPNVFLKQDPFL